MQRPRPWTFVVGVSAQIMTLYLWHLTAMVVAVGIGIALDGVGFGVTPLSGQWWATRPIWFAVLSVMTLALIGVFGRFERPSRDTRPAPPWWQPVTAVLLICAGLGFLAAIGIADDQGLNGVVLTLPIVGVVLGGISRPIWAWRPPWQAT
jgi:hypothetical protein